METAGNLSIGATLHNNTYKIEKILGQGGFGISYLAIHLKLKKRVAIKEFFPKTLCKRDDDTSTVSTATEANTQTVEKLRNKFLKEAEHIAEFDHPNIVRITDFFEENGTAYYIMDYIEGVSLTQMVKQNGPMDEVVAVGYISKIGNALSYIHSKRMNHLDIKPSNIMVRQKDNEPILIDFGLSKQYDTDGNQTSTTPVGISHGYAPMEQYNDGGVKEFSPQTDLYSLAASLYYLLSGSVPPNATTLIEEDLTFPASIPESLVGPMAKAMSTSRKRRHASVADFVEEINAALTADDDEDTDIDISKFEKPKVATKTTTKAQINHTEERKAVATSKEKSQAEPTDKKEPADKGSKANAKPMMKWIYVGAGAVLLIVLAIIFWPKSNDSAIQSVIASVTNDTVVAESQEAVPAPTEGTIDGHGFVDLGLSVKWAKCNLGASKSEEFGNYYAWGETSTKSEYTEKNSETYGVSESVLVSKGIINQNGTITSNHDAATKEWGSRWRMPTRSEMNELVSKCTWTHSSEGGKEGFTVTGPNGNSIFLPAAGEMIGDKLVPLGFYYRSSSNKNLAGQNTTSFGLTFESGRPDVDWVFHDHGFPIRPVAK